MFIAAEHGLETPQRVRQFFVHQHLEDVLPSAEIPPSGEDIVEGPEADIEYEDLPTFLRNRSLRRRLDDAFEACNQSGVADWLRAIFRR